MAEKMVEVILFQNVQYGKGGKFYSFDPSEDALDVRKVPLALYEEVAGRVPPVAELARKQSVTEGDAVVAREIYTDLKTVEEDTVDEDPILPMEFATYSGDESDLDDEDTVIEDEVEEDEDKPSIPTPPSQQEPDVGGTAETIESLMEIKFVSKAIANKLINANITTVGDVAFAGRSELLTIGGITAFNVDKIIESAKELVGA